MYRNVVTEMSPDRNGQTEKSRTRSATLGLTGLSA